MSKFETRYHDVVHGIPSEYSEHTEEAAERLSDFFEELRPQQLAAEEIELQKTPRDIELINFCGKSVDEYLTQYGRKKSIKVPLDHIQFVPTGGVEKITDGELEEGGVSSIDARVIIDRTSSDVELALRLFHEFFHIKSFNALKIKLGEGLDSYRSGISALSKEGDKIYFKDIEEAVIGLLTRRFYEEKVRGNKLFFDEFAKTKALHDTGRLDEVSMLENFITKLWERNRAQFKTRAEIEDIFIEAQVNGRLLKLAHLIERTWGKGSFRDFAEVTSSEVSGDKQ